METLTKEETVNAPLRQLVPQGYKTFGRVWRSGCVDRYNAIQERINTFIEAGLPIPEYLLFDSFCIVMKYVTAEAA